MNTTRTIRIANGAKRIELGNENMVMLQVGEVLREHRQILINSMLSDLANYIDYKFSTSASKDQLHQIKLRLIDLRNSPLNLARYSDIIADVLTNETTYVKSEPFYHEINEVIGLELNPSQLTLVK
jgi:hypothetical protein